MKLAQIASSDYFYDMAYQLAYKSFVSIPPEENAEEVSGESLGLSTALTLKLQRLKIRNLRQLPMTLGSPPSQITKLVSIKDEYKKELVSIKDEYKKVKEAELFFKVRANPLGALSFLVQMYNFLTRYF